MIEPTDAVSDEDWEEPDETTEQTSNGAGASQVASAAKEDQEEVEDDQEPSDEDSDDAQEADDVELGQGDSETDDEDAAKKRRRRKKKNGAMPAPDARTQAALDFVSKVVLEMEMDCRVRLRRPKNDDDADEVNIEIIGKDAGRIIGKKGSVLQAIQFLTHRVINRPGLERRHVLVDAEGYRSRRDNSLATMARRLGKQAVDQGKIITFEPMNPRDRRVVHLALAKFEGVITKSDGEGDNRRVQIIPVRR